MKQLEATVVIAAPAARVWQVLTDFAAFPHWNPFIRRIDGVATAGARLTVRIQPTGARGMTFRPTVLVAEPHRELRWLGRLGLPGLFDGEHMFIIAPVDAHRVRLTQREVFRGLLVPFLSRQLDRDTARGFAEMNAALKTRAEAPTAAGPAPCARSTTTGRVRSC